MLSCLTSIPNYVEMHLPISDAHLSSNQLTLELHRPTWPWDACEVILVWEDALWVITTHPNM